MMLIILWRAVKCKIDSIVTLTTSVVKRKQVSDFAFGIISRGGEKSNKNLKRSNYKEDIETQKLF